MPSLKSCGKKAEGLLLLPGWDQGSQGSLWVGRRGSLIWSALEEEAWLAVGQGKGGRCEQALRRCGLVVRPEMASRSVSGV